MYASTQLLLFWQRDFRSHIETDNNKSDEHVIIAKNYCSEHRKLYDEKGFKMMYLLTQANTLNHIECLFVRIGFASEYRNELCCDVSVRVLLNASANKTALEVITQFARST